MKKIMILGFLASIAILAIAPAILPEEVACHFDFTGTPDNWRSATSTCLISGGINLLLFVILLLLPVIIKRLPDSEIHLPNRGYWLNSENRGRTMEVIAREIHLYGFSLFLFMSCTTILMIHANLSDPVRQGPWLFLPLVALFTGFSIYWAIRLKRRFHLPGK